MNTLALFPVKNFRIQPTSSMSLINIELLELWYRLSVTMRVLQVIMRPVSPLLLTFMDMTDILWDLIVPTLAFGLQISCQRPGHQPI
jgi:hypothetical protein